MSNIWPNVWRFLGLTGVQTLLLNQIPLKVGAYFNVLLYPLFIIFLPLQLATPYLVLLGFVIGLGVDFGHGTYGVHASAGAFAGFIRPVIFAAFEPKGGFSGKEPIFAPEYFGMITFLQMAGLFFILTLLWYFSVDIFTFVYIGTITLKTIAAWFCSMICVVFYVFLFNPKS